MPEQNLQILLVDDEPHILLVLSDMLSALPYRLHTAGSAEEAIRKLSALEPEIVVCDLKLGGTTGMTVLEESKKLDLRPAFIFLTAHGDVPTAVEALKAGAFDFLLKPVAEERLQHVVRLASEKIRASIELAYLRSVSQTRSEVDTLLGESSKIKKVREAIRQIAPSRSPVLILGESGTGKELVAQAIHNAGPRSARPFVVVNAATLSRELFESELFGHERGAFTGASARRRGRFELADGGSLFLDEIGELPNELQAKLLRVLESGKIERVGGESPFSVDVRIIAATNRDLKVEIQSGNFRNDLFHRLSTFIIELPPLSERREDIGVLSSYFLSQLSHAHGREELVLGASAREALAHYHFPGNVRELRNIIERAVVMTVGNVVEAEHLFLQEPVVLQAENESLKHHLLDRERAIILAALERHGWVQAKAARDLGLNRSHLHYKIRRLGIEIPKE